jgi:hypothetical protein
MRGEKAMKLLTKFAMLLSLIFLILPGSGFASYIWYYNPDTSHYYSLTQPPPSSWTQAEAEAITQDGHLVTINDAAEQAWLNRTFGVSTYYFIGYYQINKLDEPAGNWAWISGETSSYVNWAAGEPSNGYNDEDYAQMNRYGDGKWNDIPNAVYLMLGIIESNIEKPVSPLPLPGTLLLISTGLGCLAIYRYKKRNTKN